jgi:hypothetical protein
MTEPDFLREEIKEIEAEIFRLKGSMNRADNGVKVARITILTRTLDRLKRSLAAHEKKGEAA